MYTRRPFVAASAAANPDELYSPSRNYSKSSPSARIAMEESPQRCPSSPTYDHNPTSPGPVVMDPMDAESNHTNWDDPYSNESINPYVSHATATANQIPIPKSSSTHNRVSAPSAVVVATASTSSVHHHHHHDGGAAAATAAATATALNLAIHSAQAFHANRSRARRVEGIGTNTMMFPYPKPVLPQRPSYRVPSIPVISNTESIADIIRDILHSPRIIQKESDECRNQINSSLLSARLMKMPLLTAVGGTKADLWRYLRMVTVFTKWDTCYERALQTIINFRSSYSISTNHPTILDSVPELWLKTAVVLYPHITTMAEYIPTQIVITPDSGGTTITTPSVVFNGADVTESCYVWECTVAEKFLFHICLLFPNGDFQQLYEILVSAAGTERIQISPVLARFLLFFKTPALLPTDSSQLEKLFSPPGAVPWPCGSPVDANLRLFEPFIYFSALLADNYRETGGVLLMDSTEITVPAAAASAAPTRLKRIASDAEPLTPRGLVQWEPTLRHFYLFFMWFSYALCDMVGIHHAGDRMALMRRFLVAVRCVFVSNPSSTNSNRDRIQSVLLGEMDYLFQSGSTSPAPPPRPSSVNEYKLDDSSIVKKWVNCAMSVVDWIRGISISVSSAHPIKGDRFEALVSELYKKLSSSNAIGSKNEFQMIDAQIQRFRVLLRTVRNWIQRIDFNSFSQPLVSPDNNNNNNMEIHVATDDERELYYRRGVELAAYQSYRLKSLGLPVSDRLDRLNGCLIGRTISQDLLNHTILINQYIPDTVIMHCSNRCVPNSWWRQSSNDWLIINGITANEFGTVFQHNEITEYLDYLLKAKTETRFISNDSHTNIVRDASLTGSMVWDITYGNGNAVMAAFDAYALYAYNILSLCKRHQIIYNNYNINIDTVDINNPLPVIRENDGRAYLRNAISFIGLIQPDLMRKVTIPVIADFVIQDSLLSAAFTPTAFDVVYAAIQELFNINSRFPYPPYDSHQMPLDAETISSNKTIQKTLYKRTVCLPSVSLELQASSDDAMWNMLRSLSMAAIEWMYQWRELTIDSLADIRFDSESPVPELKNQLYRWPIACWSLVTFGMNQVKHYVPRKLTGLICTSLNIQLPIEWQNADEKKIKDPSWPYEPVFLFVDQDSAIDSIGLIEIPFYTKLLILRAIMKLVEKNQSFPVLDLFSYISPRLPCTKQYFGTIVGFQTHRSYQNLIDNANEIFDSDRECLLSNSKRLASPRVIISDNNNNIVDPHAQRYVAYCALIFSIFGLPEIYISKRDRVPKLALSLVNIGLNDARLGCISGFVNREKSKVIGSDLLQMIVCDVPLFDSCVYNPLFESLFCEMSEYYTASGEIDKISKAFTKRVQCDDDDTESDNDTTTTIERELKFIRSCVRPFSSASSKVADPSTSIAVYENNIHSQVQHRRPRSDSDNNLNSTSMQAIVD